MSPTRVDFYANRIRELTVTIPEKAHKLSAAEAAGLSARAIRGSGTGALARDVSRPKFVGSMHALVGSNLPYAAMENWGGTITAKSARRLLIRGKRTARSAAGGAITASAEQVQHEGKGYLDLALDSFQRLYIANLKRMMP